MLHHMCQRGPAEIRHAHCLEGLGAVKGVDGYDVGVLQLRECPRFPRDVVGDLQRHLPPREWPLLRQIHPAKRPAAEFADQPEAQKLYPHFR
jgi:hypothetical protein